MWMVHRLKPLRRLALEKKGKELGEKRRKFIRGEISERDGKTWRVLQSDAFYAKA
jgi:hypothetical protein